MLTEELLNALAHDHFNRLENRRTHWAIVHLSHDGESTAEICDKTLDRLLDTWIEVVASIEAEKCIVCQRLNCRNHCTDEGVEKMTAGIEPNDPLTTKYGVAIDCDASGRPVADRPERYLR